MADNYAALRVVTVEDVPDEYRDLAEVIGLDVFLEICRFAGGEDLYIPKIESIERAGRNREIRSRFNGGNYKQLARMFRMSERQVRKIINGEGR
jgi:Mor family transcriptional regulator